MAADILNQVDSYIPAPNANKDTIHTGSFENIKPVHLVVLSDFDHGPPKVTELDVAPHSRSKNKFPAMSWFSHAPQEHLSAGQHQLCGCGRLAHGCIFQEETSAKWSTAHASSCQIRQHGY